MKILTEQALFSFDVELEKNILGFFNGFFGIKSENDGYFVSTEDIVRDICTCNDFDFPKPSCSDIGVLFRAYFFNIERDVYAIRNSNIDNSDKLAMSHMMTFDELIKAKSRCFSYRFAKFMELLVDNFRSLNDYDNPYFKEASSLSILASFCGMVLFGYKAPDFFNQDFIDFVTRKQLSGYEMLPYLEQMIDEYEDWLSFGQLRPEYKLFVDNIYSELKNKAIFSIVRLNKSVIHVNCDQQAIHLCTDDVFCKNVAEHLALVSAQAFKWGGIADTEGSDDIYDFLERQYIDDESINLFPSYLKNINKAETDSQREKTECAKPRYLVVCPQKNKISVSDELKHLVETQMFCEDDDLSRFIDLETFSETIVPFKDVRLFIKGNGELEMRCVLNNGTNILFLNNKYVL